MSFSLRAFFYPFIIAAIFAGCAVKQPETKKPAAEAEAVPPLTKSSQAPSSIVANMPTKAFFGALNNSITYYERFLGKEANFTYCDQNYTAEEMIDSLKLFEKLSKLPKEQFFKKLDDDFDLYESKNDKNSALITGYYAPVLNGSFEKTEKFNAPIYPLPSDIITADLRKFKVAHSIRDIVGRIEGKELVPYYTREEIENGALKEKPLLYLESKVDAFLLGVQGSGIVDIDGKKYYIGYAGKNGRPYTSIGKIVYKEKLIDPSKINMQTIKAYLENNKTMCDHVLLQNKSFVFFKINKKEGVFGNIAVPLTAKESVAMDSKLIPKGGIAYIKTEIPKKLNGLAVVPRTAREPFEKFFMVQDTGGAIRGGGRVDIYFGEGPEALFYAGQTASKGIVYLLVAKKKALKLLNSIGK